MQLQPFYFKDKQYSDKNIIANCHHPTAAGNAKSKQDFQVTTSAAVKTEKQNGIQLELLNTTHNTTLESAALTSVGQYWVSFYPHSTRECDSTLGPTAQGRNFINQPVALWETKTEDQTTYSGKQVKMK